MRFIIAIIGIIFFEACVINKDVMVLKEKIAILDKKGRKLTFESELNCSAQKIWDAYRESEFINEISRPKGKLKAKKGYKVPARWFEARTDSFNLTIQGLVPMGSHYIHWEKIDEENLVIQTRENGGFISVWDNLVSIKPTSDSTCMYRDELVVRAGILTGVTTTWAKGFYKYRHKKLRAYCVQQ